MNIIAAVDRNWAIGMQGDLLVSIPYDKKLFREETLGKTIIMGRKTFESLPGKQPLYHRRNIVLSRDKNFYHKDIIVLHSLEEVLNYIRKENLIYHDIFIIGGAEIYQLFLPYCDIAHITYIHHSYHADTHMKNLDMDKNWKLVMETDEETYFDLEYTFRMYKRISKEE